MLPPKPALMAGTLTAPDGLPHNALRFWLIVQSLGGDRSLFDELVGKLYLPETDLVRSLVPWLQEHRREIPEGSARSIADWALHEFTETERLRTRNGPSIRTFSMKGRSVARVLEACDEYRRRLSAAGTRYHTWPKRGWDWESEAGGEACTVVELATGEELQRESAELNHCVATYAQNCVEGFSAIFSLRVAGERRLTLEVHPGIRRVVQARGFANRLPTPAETAMVQLWVAAKLRQWRGATAHRQGSRVQNDREPFFVAFGGYLLDAWWAGIPPGSGGMAPSEPRTRRPRRPTSGPRSRHGPVRARGGIHPATH